MFLTEDEVIELTSRKQVQAQAERLREAEIRFIIVAGKVKVLRDDVLSMKTPSSKEIRKL